MSGKRGRSGRPSKHGGYLFLRTGELPPEKKFIELRLSKLREELLTALGDDVGPGQVVLIDQIVQFQGFTDLIHLYLKQGASPFYMDKGQLKVQPALSSFYIACTNSISRNIERLGLSKSGKKGFPGVAELLQSISGPPSDEELKEASKYMSED